MWLIWFEEGRGGRAGSAMDMIPLIMHLEMRILCFGEYHVFISKVLFVPKSNLRALSSQRLQPCTHVRLLMFLCVLWVSIPWCHIATRAHTVDCLCSSCLTDTSRCAHLHRQVICFICCNFDLLCFVRFIFLWQP